MDSEQVADNAEAELEIEVTVTHAMIGKIEVFFAVMTDEAFIRFIEPFLSRVFHAVLEK